MTLKTRHAGKTLSLATITIDVQAAATATPTPTAPTKKPTTGPTVAPITPPTKGPTKGPTAPPTPSATPPAVSGFTAAGNATDVTLRWTSLSGIAYYDIAYGPTSGSDDSTVRANASASSASIPVGCEVTRYFKIKAYGDGATYRAAWGPWSSSSPLSATTGDCPTATPTPTPQPLSFSETSVSVVFQRGAQVNRKLPEAVGGGLQPFAYSVSPALGNGLRFNLGAVSIVGTPSAAATTSVYTYSVSDGSGGHASMELRVTVFDVSVPASGGTIGTTHWGVLHHESVEVSDPLARSNFSFRLAVQASTGFQVGSSTCTWPGPSSVTYTHWSSLNTPILIVRCERGSGGSIEVWVRSNADHTRTWRLSSTTIKQAWHRNDNVVAYHVVGSSGNVINGVDLPLLGGMFRSSRPSNLPSDYQPNPELLKLSNYANAAAAWNGASAGVTIRRAGPREVRDVVIAGYWDTNPSNGVDPKCGRSIACTAGTGTYPHIENGQPFWIEDPPHWGFMVRNPITGRMEIPAAKSWTIKISEAGRPDKQYLPAVLMHEFGHTIGVGHSASRNTIMSGLGMAPSSTLHAEDKAAARAIYQGHVSDH